MYDMFLKIVGILTLIVVGLVLIFALYLYFQWHKFKKYAGMDFEAMEVKLEEDTAATWTTFDQAKAYKKELDALGFTEVSTYTTSIGIDLWLFLNSDYKHGASITHVAGDITMEFTATDAIKGTAIDVTDNPQVAALTPKPYKISIGRPDLSPRELHDVFLKTVEDIELQPMPPEEIAGLVESQFKKEMAALTEMGGPSEEDFDNIVELWGKNLPEKDRKALLQEGKEDNFYKKQMLYIDKLSESNLMTPKMWEQYEGCMIAVREDDDVSLFANYLKSEMDLEAESLELLKSQTELVSSSEELMKIMTEKLSDHKIKCIGELDTVKFYGYEYPDY